MSTRFLNHVVFAACALSVAFAGAAAPATPPPSSAIQQRIDALLKRRLRPEPLPVNLPNPFQMSSGIVREASPEEAAARSAAEVDGVALANAVNQGRVAAVANPVEVLAAVSSRFKIGGIITLKDQLQVVINGMPRREGDSVAADLNGALIFVKIVRLTPGQMSLRYGDAEIAMKF
jgi:hypothetical protein